MRILKAKKHTDHKNDGIIMYLKKGFCTFIAKSFTYFNYIRVLSPTRNQIHIAFATQIQIHIEINGLYRIGIGRLINLR
jgi:hypothetical protein